MKLKYPSRLVIDLVVLNPPIAVQHVLLEHVDEDVKPKREYDDPTVERSQSVRLDQHDKGHRQIEDVLQSREAVIDHRWEKI
jgi:hypothetical protein